MSENITLLLGGLGLFLLGMAFLTDGLKVLAGHRLRKALQTATSNHVAAVSTGVVATAVIQSSSATTLMAIGFVNAGLIGLEQTIGLIYGANIGTTLTAWVVALVGVKVKTTVFALPFVGVGAMMKLFLKDRAAAIGAAIAGFGLLFHGIDLMQAGTSPSSTFSFEALSSTTVMGRIGLAAIGALMTVLMQSSSAALAVTLAAVSTGAIAVPEAAALAVGQNVGTTFTAILAVAGDAKTNARRAAAAHVLFNVTTGVLALVLLGPFLTAVENLAALSGLNDPPALLSAFHTAFNVLGVLIMTPFISQTSNFLMRVIPERKGARGTPRFLDRSVLSMPGAALAAVDLELESMAAHVYELVDHTLTPGRHRTHGDEVRRATELKNDVDAVGDEVLRFLEQIAKAPSVSPRIFSLVHVLTHLRALTHEAHRSIDARHTLEQDIKRIAEVDAMEDVLRDAVKIMRHPMNDADTRRMLMKSIDERCEIRRSSTRDKIFSAVPSGELTPQGALLLADHVNTIGRIVHDLARAAHAWSEGLSSTTKSDATIDNRSVTTSKPKDEHESRSGPTTPT